jgi:hypothetical protein
MHKLTDSDVDAMRAEYSRGGVTQRALARQYGCSQSQVSNVLLLKQRVDETHFICNSYKSDRMPSPVPDLVAAA